MGWKEFVVLDWFNISLWLFMLIAGITLWVLSGNERYILWVKNRMRTSEEKVKNMEKSSAIAVIVIAILNLLRIFIKY